MRTKHLYVSIHIRIKREAGAFKMFKPSSDVLLSITKRCFFCGCFLLFMFHALLYYSVLYGPCKLFSPAGKGLTSCLSFV